jgi:catechol 2,3-dioxygenase-like lactoylglutathione lyase family enzyme
LFKDEAVASLMTKYTNGKKERRDAYLSFNMVGGGGLEIWQFKNRVPCGPKVPIELGDIGIFAMKIRCSNLVDAHDYLQKMELANLTPITTPNKCNNYFYFEDPFGNHVQMVEDSYRFCKYTSNNGGVMGAVIGVSDMQTSMDFYSKFLGYSIVLYNQVETLRSTSKLARIDSIYRKVILGQERLTKGGFADLLGPNQLELIQVLDRTPVKIYKNRLWGDLGYIHLCFDIQGMASLREKAKQIDHPFTVDSSNSFDMGDAAGHFSYVEDPDGTLIELVETHKVPILKSLGLFLNLKKRDSHKTLPKWLVKSLSFHRVRQDL